MEQLEERAEAARAGKQHLHGVDMQQAAARCAGAYGVLSVRF